MDASDVSHFNEAGYYDCNELIKSFLQVCSSRSCQPGTRGRPALVTNLVVLTSTRGPPDWDLRPRLGSAVMIRIASEVLDAHG